jgi:hypothetical protein
LLSPAVCDYTFRRPPLNSSCKFRKNGKIFSFLNKPKHCLAETVFAAGEYPAFGRIAKHRTPLSFGAYKKPPQVSLQRLIFT